MTQLCKNGFIRENVGIIQQQVYKRLEANLHSLEKLRFLAFGALKLKTRQKCACSFRHVHLSVCQSECSNFKRNFNEI
jgi:hypothetical protein